VSPPDTGFLGRPIFDAVDGGDKCLRNVGLHADYTLQICYLRTRLILSRRDVPGERRKIQRAANLCDCAQSSPCCIRVLALVSPPLIGVGWLLKYSDRVRTSESECPVLRINAWRRQLSVISSLDKRWL
jgi:hypothetical protein